MRTLLGEPLLDRRYRGGCRRKEVPDLPNGSSAVSSDEKQVVGSISTATPFRQAPEYQ